MTVVLNREVRRALRSKVRSHQDWATIANGRKVEMLSKDELLTAAAALKIDVAALLDTAPAAADTAALPEAAMSAPQPASAEVVPLWAGVDAASQVERITAHKAFRLRAPLRNSRTKDALEVSVYNSNHPQVPVRDQHYVYDREALRLAVICANARPTLRLFLYGPKSTGKTQFCQNFAADLKRPFFRVNFNAAQEEYDWLGGEKPEGGRLVWRDGILLQALRTPGAVILLDEPSTGRPEFMAALHALLERPGTVAIGTTGERVTVADDTIIFAADNTNGTGDHVGSYVNTREMSAALCDRFAYMCRMKYIDAATEARRLVEIIGMPEPAALILANVADKMRAKELAGEIDYAPGVRAVEAWAQGVWDGLDLREAFTLAVSNKQSPIGAEACQQLFRDLVPDDAAFERALDPNAPPVAPPTTADGTSEAPEPQPLF